MDLYEKIVESFINADKVLIGIGTGLHKPDTKIIDFYNTYLEKKDYFIITSRTDNLFFDVSIDEKKVCNALLEDNEKQWTLYNKWLSATLNKKLLIIELGEDFSRPHIFRWPFEKIVFINKLSTLYRINEKFYQLPENIGDRAYGHKINVNNFIEEFMKVLKMRNVVC